jgi:hypothetical protein
MDVVTLSPGDQIEVTLEGKTYTGVIRDVINTSGKEYLLTIESGDEKSPIRSVRVTLKPKLYLSI